jgi:predicted PolB exonuclease-like 3'-5' exonuclease
MASIKIATGIKTYDVEDQNGNVRGQIKFNPSDINFIKRLTEMEDKLNEYMSKYSELNNDVISSPESDNVESEAMKSLAALNFYDKQAKKVINETFDDDHLSDVIFGSESCFNILNGETFMERFLNGVIPVIKEDVEKATKNINEHVSKYTAQIHEK